MLYIENAVGYVRVSTTGQVERAHSLPAQRRAIQEFAKASGYNLLKIFSDEGITGTVIHKRKGYNEMMEYVKQNNIKVILVHKFDRLHRNELNMLKDRKFFDKNNIECISISEHLSTKDDSLLISLKATLAEDFSNKLSKETRKGQNEAALEAKFLGGKAPYGFCINSTTKKYEIDEEKAPVVQKIFEMFCNDMGYTRIIEWLNKNKYKTNNNKSFCKATINSMLKNEKYIGVYTWDKTAAKDEEGRRNSHKLKENYIRIEGGCPQIVDKELFETVQQKLKGNYQKYSRANSKHYYMLNGLHTKGKVICQCSARMTGNVQITNKSKNKYYQYRCSNKCGAKAVNADYLDEIVAFAVKECIFSQANIEKIKEELISYEKEQLKRFQEIIRKSNENLQILKKQRENLYVSIENNGGNKGLIARLNEKDDEIKAIEDEISELRNCQDNRINNERITELEENFVEYLRKNDNVECKYLIDSVIDSVVVKDDTVEINFKSGLEIDKNTRKIFS